MESEWFFIMAVGGDSPGMVPDVHVIESPQEHRSGDIKEDTFDPLLGKMLRYPRLQLSDFDAL